MKRRLQGLLISLLLLGSILLTGLVPEAEATTYATPAAMMDAEWLGPHHSEITGAMVQAAWKAYGIPPHIYLTIIGAETGMGDTVNGGLLVGAHNYGCIAFNGYTSRWGEPASGTIDVAGRTWYRFPTVQIGVNAVGRLLKVGPSSRPGYYLSTFKDNRGWYEAFASVYYGAHVAGYGQYVENLEKIDAKLCKVAAEHGWRW